MSNLLNLISGGVLVFVPNYVSILVFRTILGLGVKGSWMSSYVLRKDV